MPNYCENHLTITGLRKDLEAFRDRATLREASSAGEEATPLCFKRLLPIPDPLFDIEDYEYDWMLAHWGCHRSAEDAECFIFCDDKGRGQLVYEFLTAWSPPVRLIETVSASHPNLTFSLIAFEVGVQFAALYIARRGIIITDIEGCHNASLMDDAFQEGPSTSWRFIPHQEGVEPTAN